MGCSGSKLPVKESSSASSLVGDDEKPPVSETRPNSSPESDRAPSEPSRSPSTSLEEISVEEVAKDQAPADVDDASNVETNPVASNPKDAEKSTPSINSQRSTPPSPHQTQNKKPSSTRKEGGSSSSKPKAKESPPRSVSKRSIQDMSARREELLTSVVGTGVFQPSCFKPLRAQQEPHHHHHHHRQAHPLVVSLHFCNSLPLTYFLCLCLQPPNDPFPFSFFVQGAVVVAQLWLPMSLNEFKRMYWTAGRFYQDFLGFSLSDLDIKVTQGGAFGCHVQSYLFGETFTSPYLLDFGVRRLSDVSRSLTTCVTE